MDELAQTESQQVAALQPGVAHETSLFRSIAIGTGVAIERLRCCHAHYATICWVAAGFALGSIAYHSSLELYGIIFADLEA
ncbi:hypothetical protein KC325_g20 [Hortaea werneckii]|nr:hypothetical protein KC325_g20 [Hortaea werneckii]